MLAINLVHSEPHELVNSCVYMEIVLVYKVIHSIRNVKSIFLLDLFNNKVLCICSLILMCFLGKKYLSLVN